MPKVMLMGQILHLCRCWSKMLTVANIVERLRSTNSFDSVVVVSSTASDSASLQFLAPYAGCTMGEYFRDNACPFSGNLWWLNETRGGLSSNVSIATPST